MIPKRVKQFFCFHEKKVVRIEVGKEVVENHFVLEKKTLRCCKCDKSFLEEGYIFKDGVKAFLGVE